LSAYDASYLELAQRTGFPIATLDHALEAAAHKCGVMQFSALLEEAIKLELSKRDSRKEEGPPEEDDA
jgi:hypothetical protein